MSGIEAQPTLLPPGAEHRAACAAHPVHLVLFGAGCIDLTECEPVALLVMSRASQELETLACCLMPDRFEWLLADRRELADRVERVKEISTRAGGRLGLRDPVWSCGFAELPVDPDDLSTAARAIQELPVRERLVRSVLEWPYQLRRL